nr:hypothetical protein [uncultured Desulfuromonas sp.]
MEKRLDIQPTQWVEPVLEYQRLADRYQTVEERAESERKKHRALKRPERRFVALRKLVTHLKKNYSFIRVDHVSAERELRQLGLRKIHNDLATLLSGLEVTTTATNDIVGQVTNQASLFQLGHNGSTAQLDHLIYANLSHGLQVLTLEQQNIRIPVIDLSCVALLERCQDKRLMASHNNLLLSVHASKKNGTEKSSVHEGFILDLSIAMGVIEINDSGRRAFIYQQSDTSFALYADKQISIEI